MTNDSNDQQGSSGGASVGEEQAARGPGEDLLAQLIEEIDDTNAILEGLRRRGVPDQITSDVTGQLPPGARGQPGPPGRPGDPGRPAGPQGSAGGRGEAGREA